MDLQLDLFTLIGFTGVLQGLILSLFLFRYDPKETPQNRILAFLALVFSIFSCGAMLYYSRLIYQVPWLIRVHSPFAYLLAPLMYLYIKMMLYYEYRLHLSDYLHFLPFVIALLFFSPIYIIPVPAKLEYIKHQFQFNSPDILFLYISVLLSGFIYYILIIRMLVRAYREEKEYETSRYQGIKKWVIIFTFFFIAALITSLVRVYTGISNHNTHWVPVLFAVMIYYLSYEGLQKPFIFESHPDPKYTNSKINNASLKKLLTKAESYVDENEIYLKNHVSINELANLIQVQVNNLSRAINEITNENYFGFINTFRIKKAKKLLLEKDFENYSVEGIGLECGFKSKASFYSAFKKLEKMTPNQYRSRYSVQDSKVELQSL